MQLSSSIDTGLKMKELGGLYISFDGNKPKNLSNISKTQKNPNNQDEVNNNNCITLNETLAVFDDITEHFVQMLLFSEAKVQEKKNCIYCVVAEEECNRSGF